MAEFHLATLTVKLLFIEEVSEENDRLVMIR